MISKEQNHETHQSLSELVTSLSEEDSRKYLGVIRSINLPITAFEGYCSWSGKSYTRNCIVDNEKYELILLCWEEGQKTPIHDHGGEECWVRVLQGEFRETVYEIDKAGDLNAVKTSMSKAGDISYMIDFMGFHCLENLSTSRSMTLHLYAKPIRSCNLIDEKSGKSVRKELTYCTVPESMMT